MGVPGGSSSERLGNHFGGHRGGNGNEEAPELRDRQEAAAAARQSLRAVLSEA